MTDAKTTAEEQRIAALSDADLLDEYSRCEAAACEAACDLLAGEIERRGLDI